MNAWILFTSIKCYYIALSAWMERGKMICKLQIDVFHINDEKWMNATK